MESSTGVSDYELIYIIINHDFGSKVLHSAKQCGISGGTVLLGKGTVNNKILDFLGLSDVRKEIILLLAERSKAIETLKKLDEEYKFEKPNHGIAFTIPVGKIIGASSCKCDHNKEERGVSDIMYHAITVIVERGKAEDVIDAATIAGSKGGTIINGRGSGIHETSKLFLMDIEPEKEIVLILSKIEKTETIVSSIREKLKIDEPGNGIIYIQDVNETFGIYD